MRTGKLPTPDYSFLKHIDFRGSVFFSSFTVDRWMGSSDLSPDEQLEIIQRKMKEENV